MRKLLFLIVISTFSFNINCQDFAPIGAKWYYSKHYAFSGDIDYFKIESVKDTIINETNCKKLVKNSPLGCSNRDITEFVYQKDSIIYFFDKDFNEFQTLFNLKADIDSSWYIKVMQYVQEIDTLFVTVTSTDFIEINSNTLKRLFVNYSGISNSDTLLQYSSQILETIGDIQYLFNIYPNWSIACDIDYSGGLRCYSDDILGSYETGIADSCTYTYKWTNLNNLSKPSVVIYPNPTYGKLNINLSSNKKLYVTIKDMAGHVLRSKIIDSNSMIDISDCIYGIYILTVRDKENYTIIEKIIKF